MSGHTPGPWKVVPPKPYAIYYQRKNELDNPDDIQIASHIYDEDHANLIAAAPDLLQWLQVILDHVDYTNGACSLTEPVGAVLSMYVIKQARAAIARAEGQAE